MQMSCNAGKTAIGIGSAVDWQSGTESCTRIGPASQRPTWDDGDDGGLPMAPMPCLCRILLLLQAGQRRTG